MANKRQLKKYLKNTAANIAGETVFIINYFENVDEAKANDIIDRTLQLLTEKVAEASVSFDKTYAISFNKDRKAYRKEKVAYFKQCYKKLVADYNEGVKAILKDMNALITPEQHKELIG